METYQQLKEGHLEGAYNMPLTVKVIPLVPLLPLKVLKQVHLLRKELWEVF